MSSEEINMCIFLLWSKCLQGFLSCHMSVRLFLFLLLRFSAVTGRMTRWGLYSATSLHSEAWGINYSLNAQGKWQMWLMGCCAGAAHLKERLGRLAPLAPLALLGTSCMCFLNGNWDRSLPIPALQQHMQTLDCSSASVVMSLWSCGRNFCKSNSSVALKKDACGNTLTLIVILVFLFFCSWSISPGSVKTDFFQCWRTNMSRWDLVLYS